MCSILGAISLAATAIGAGVSAYGSYQQGKAQSAQSEYQAQIAARNAKQSQMQADYSREQAAEDAAQHRRQVGQTIGTQRSLLASSGVDISDTDSSAMSILGDTAQWGEYDAQKIVHQGAMKAWGYENQAVNEQANAAMYSMGAKQATRAGAIGAGASLLAGAGQVAGQWYQFEKEGWGKPAKTPEAS